MTKARKEQLSNRLVMNFGIILAGCLALLYVNSALRSGVTAMNIAYWVILSAGIIGLAGFVTLFIIGRIKKNKMQNYSAIFLGVFVVSAIIYISKLNWIPGYDNIVAMITAYIAMAVYYVIMAVVIGIVVHRPTVKTEEEKAEQMKRLAHKKKRKK